MGEREFDVVVWGATGFTGELVAEYLATHAEVAERQMRWALGGRSQDKLEVVRARLAERAPHVAELPLIVADATDAEAMDALAQRTRVIATTVGPYRRYGKVLARACATHGTHTCDLTGEPLFVRWCADELTETAHQSGARIVNCCGFDSIPSDLGVWLVQQTALERHGQPCSRVDTHVQRLKGSFSGGTAATMLDTVEQATDKAARRILGDPYSLIPDGSPRGSDGQGVMKPTWDAARDTWIGPFVMESINAKVVRRSHALAGLPWGEDFAYSECSSTGKGLSGWWRAASMSAGLGALMLGISSPLKPLVVSRLPSPGEGPDRAARQAGMCRYRIFGTGTPEPVVVLMETPQDPGYGSTAIMLGESALCLAFDELDSDGGVWTPATAMAAPLLERLRAGGLVFDPE